MADTLVTFTPASKADATTVKKVIVILDQDHIDSGTSYEAGAELETDSVTADWIVKNGVGHLK